MTRPSNQKLLSSPYKTRLSGLINGTTSLPCYQRVIDLIQSHQLALHALHFDLMKYQQNAYLWVASTTLPVCKNQRIQRHKSLAKIASRDKSSMCWFYGCKLHLIMNQ